jgi:ABC-2 type transport system ATP-binding protein
LLIKIFFKPNPVVIHLAVLFWGTSELDMIEIEKLHKKYGHFTALECLDLRVAPGEIFGFLGPNGAGKTTTIKILTGLLQPTSGRARIGGFDVVLQGPQAKAITSLIPDRPYLYEKLTPMEYLRFLTGIYRLDDADARRRSGEFLEMFGLTPWKDELIEGFSHGMKQKVVMAGALLPNPKALIVDEPMVGLDPASAKLVKGLFTDLAKRGTAILLSTHTLEVAQKLCHRIGIIHRSRLIAEGTLDELRERSHAKAADLESVFLEITGTPDEAPETAP